MKCFLDMDGVLCDFISAACDIHGLDYGVIGTDYHLGLGVERFWQPIHDAGSSFWADLKPMPWYKTLLSVVDSCFDHWCVLSCPSKMVHDCCRGKHEWLERHGVVGSGPPVFDCDKGKYATCDSVLIDDDQRKCLAFTEAGGIAVWWPSSWNDNNEPLDNVLAEIRRLSDAANIQV